MAVKEKKALKKQVEVLEREVEKLNFRINGLLDTNDSWLPMLAIFISLLALITASLR